jgi:putative ABC transport system substrate-binding protein
VNRRAFIALLGGAVAAWPLAARAQQSPEVPRVGFVYPGSKAAAATRIEAVLSGLRVSGYAAPAQVEIVVRIADDDPAQIAPLVEELIAKNVFKVPDYLATFFCLICHSENLPMVAFGTKRTCRPRRECVDPAQMTLSGHWPD